MLCYRGSWGEGGGVKGRMQGKSFPGSRSAQLESPVGSEFGGMKEQAAWSSGQKRRAHPAGPLHLLESK